MAHRTFTDTLGFTWEVWEVHPGRAIIGTAVDHRRGGDRRAKPVLGAAPPAGPPPGQVERRSGIERRVAVAAPLQRGWLAFRSGDERRRLAPIPAAWERASDIELAAYCAAAELADVRRQRE